MRFLPQFFFICCLGFFSSAKVPCAPTCEVVLMSYNIRLDVESDGVNRWSQRRDFWLNQVRFHAPDILGVQEAVPGQMQDLANGLPGYQYVGVAREDGINDGEYSAVFYKASNWKVMEEGTFWLSETPEQPSIGWDAACKRICSYARFRGVESDHCFWVFNTHLDHMGNVARASGVALIMQRLQSLAKPEDVVFLTGDFNAEPDSEPIQEVLQTMQDCRSICSGPVLGPVATFNAFDYATPASHRIDYLFVRSNHVEVQAFATLTDAVEGHYPSDHFPVIAKCKLLMNP